MLKEDTENILNIYTVIYWVRIAWRIENINNIDYYKYLFSKFSLQYKIYRWKEYNKEFVIFSKQEKIINYLFLSHTHKIKNDDQMLWKIYWYPWCCMKNIKDTLLIDDSLAEVSHTLDNSHWEIFDFKMNIFFWTRLFFHVPCSLNCKYTLDIAEKHLILLKKTLSEQEFVELCNGKKWKYLYNSSILTFN
jgi:hypothetical protein